jgi:hypothetical protein
LTKVENFLEDERNRVLLLHSNAGGGKPLFGRFMQNQLWEKRSDHCFIPIFLDLSTSKEVTDEVFEKAFLDYGLSKQYIEILKGHQFDRFLFIFDGFNELSEPINLSENYNIPTWPNSKIIVTARTDFSRSIGTSQYQRNFLLKYFNVDVEYYIQPFTINQQKAFIQHFIDNDHFKNQWEPVLNALEENVRIIGVSAILSNPFTLNIIIEQLDDILLEKQMGRYSKITRAVIYTHYITNVFLKASLIMKEYSSSDISFPIHYDQYSQIAWKLLAMLLAGNMFMKNIQIINSLQEQFYIPVHNNYHELPNEEWKSFVLDMKMAFAFSERVSMIFKRVGNGLTFRHPCLYEYFTAKVLFEELLGMTRDESSSNHVSALDETAFFNQQSLQKHPSILQLLLEMIEDQSTVQSTIIHALWQIVDQSKHTASVAIGAGNALTLLVLCKVSFKQRELSNIWIDGAIIDSHIFEEVNFTNAHLTSISWNNVDLHHCNFTNCIFQDNDFKERATLSSPVIGSIYKIHVLTKYHIVLAAGFYPGFVVWKYGECIYSNPELHGCEIIISPDQLWVSCKLSQQVWLYSVKHNTIVHEITNVQNLSQVRNNGLIYCKNDKKTYFLYYKERVKDPRKIYEKFDDKPEIAEIELELNKELTEMKCCIDLKDDLKACVFKDKFGWLIVGTFSLTINHCNKNFFSVDEDPESKKNKLTLRNVKTFNYEMIVGIYGTPFFLVSNIANKIYVFDARTLHIFPNLDHLSSYEGEKFIISPKGQFLLIKYKTTVHVLSINIDEDHPTMPVIISFLYTMENIRSEITTEQFSADEKYIVWGLNGRVVVTKTIEKTIVQEVYLRKKRTPVVMAAFLMTPECNEDNTMEQKALGNPKEAQLIVLQDIGINVIRLKLEIDEYYEDKVNK